MAGTPHSVAAQDEADLMAYHWFFTIGNVVTVRRGLPAY